MTWHEFCEAMRYAGFWACLRCGGWELRERWHGHRQRCGDLGGGDA